MIDKRSSPVDPLAMAAFGLRAAKDFFGLLGFELADAVVIQGEQFSRYMGVPDLEADHVIMALPGAAAADPSGPLSPSGAA